MRVKVQNWQMACSPFITVEFHIYARGNDRIEDDILVRIIGLEDLNKYYACMSAPPKQIILGGSRHRGEAKVVNLGFFISDSFYAGLR